MTDLPQAPSELEEAFALAWRARAHLVAGAERWPDPERGFEFYPGRRWAFDFAWPDHLVAVECDGGQWKPGGGRHNTDDDREKLNAAALMGWRVLRYSLPMLDDPEEVINEVMEALRWHVRFYTVSRMTGWVNLHKGERDDGQGKSV